MAHHVAAMFMFLEAVQGEKESRDQTSTADIGSCSDTPTSSPPEPPTTMEIRKYLIYLCSTGRVDLDLGVISRASHSLLVEICVALQGR